MEARTPNEETTLSFQLVPVPLDVDEHLQDRTRRRRRLRTLCTACGVLAITAAVVATALSTPKLQYNVTQEHAIAGIENTSVCQRVNYVVEDKQVYAQSLDGSESVRINIKGVNWFGYVRGCMGRFVL